MSSCDELCLSLTGFLLLHTKLKQDDDGLGLNQHDEKKSLKTIFHPIFWCGIVRFFNCDWEVLQLSSSHPQFINVYGDIDGNGGDAGIDVSGLVACFVLQEEKLDGENRYFCESCQNKQSATRRIRLHSLPPTLNLQLMRFVFDRSAATRGNMTLTAPLC